MAKFKMSKEQKLGLFIVVVLISIYGVINFLKGKELFSKQIHLYATFYEVDGLAPTTPVYLQGLKIGSIEAISWNKESAKMDVNLAIQGRYKIPKNSYATSFSTDLLGSRAIKIVLGDSPNQLENKDTIATQFELGLIEELAASFSPLIEKIDTLLATTHSAVEKINSLFNEEIELSLKSSIKNLEETLKNSNQLTAELQQSGSAINQIIENANSIVAKLEGEDSPLNQSLQSVATITEQLKEADLGKAVEQIRGLIVSLENPNGSVGKLLHTDSLHNSIEALVRELNQLVEGITQNPKKYIKITVF